MAGPLRPPTPIAWVPKPIFEAPVRAEYGASSLSNLTPFSGPSVWAKTMGGEPPVMATILILFLIGLLIAALPPPSYKFRQRKRHPLWELPSLPDL
jgi:hypothetical protein